MRSQTEVHTASRYPHLDILFFLSFIEITFTFLGKITVLEGRLRFLGYLVETENPRDQFVFGTYSLIKELVFVYRSEFVFGTQVLRELVFSSI